MPADRFRGIAAGMRRLIDLWSVRSAEPRIRRSTAIVAR